MKTTVTPMTIAAVSAAVLPFVAMSAGPPASKKSPVTDTYHGVEVVDPYRWLEQWPSEEVKAWTGEQNAYAREFLDSRPKLDAIRADVTEILSAKTVGYWDLQVRGDRYFCMKSQPPKQQAFLITFESLDDLSGERVLLDPAVIDPDGGTTIDWFVPSPDGSVVAVSLSVGGTEAGDLHFFDVESGEKIHQVVPRVNTGTAGGSLAWAADGKGVFYTRHPREGEKPKQDMNFFQQAYFHELGTDTADDRYELGKDFPRIAEIQFEPHHASGQLLLTVQDGDGGKFAHYLRSPDGTWRNFSGFGDKMVNATFSRDGESLYILSRADAPRGKILRMSCETLAWAPSIPIVPESEDTLVTSFYGRPPSILPTATRLYVQYQTGGPSEIRCFDLDGEPLLGPPQLTVSSTGGMVALGDVDSDTIYYTDRSYLVPLTGCRYDPQAGKSDKTALRSNPPVDLEALGVTVVREFATSKDGTRVPVNIRLPRGFELGKSPPAPALVSGYGGYGISLSPSYSSLDSVLLKQGVIQATANLRGGGEYGEEWHTQGNLTNKQNVFDDFAAVLQHMINRGYTSSDRLAIEGGSNGGLLMGALLTQHPDLVEAVVTHVGIYDSLRVELSPNGAFNIPEFGTVKNPDHFRALYGYSPYHNVKNDTDYPATFFLTGVNDPRVEAMQSRKMTAMLQAAQADRDAPILLRTSFDSGHGAGTPLDERIAQAVDVHAFIIDRLGVDYRVK
jgi:prolyl oligopeptidase